MYACNCNSWAPQSISQISIQSALTIKFCSSGSSTIPEGYSANNWCWHTSTNGICMSRMTINHWHKIKSIWMVIRNPLQITHNQFTIDVMCRNTWRIWPIHCLGRLEFHLYFWAIFLLLTVDLLGFLCIAAVDYTVLILGFPAAGAALLYVCTMHLYLHW